MEDYIQFSAKTKNDAITKACIELGTSSDQLEIQVVSEGSSGFFGIGSKPAVIKVRKKEMVSEEEEIKDIIGSVKLDSFKTEKKKKESSFEKPEEKKVSEKISKENTSARYDRSEKSDRNDKVEKSDKCEKPVKERYTKERQTKEKPVRAAKPVPVLVDPEEIKEAEERAKVFLRDVFASMKLGEVEITAVYNKNDGSLDVNFEGEDMGVLIGKRGQTLDSLQYLTSLVVNKGKENYIRVKLDTEDYRRRRKETLENLARGIAYKVKKTRRPVVLEPMNPYERRIIHSALQGNKFVETVSEGEEPYRHVVVKLKRN